jgi:hypothetical protein
MTRGTLFSTLLTAPIGALLGAQPKQSGPEDERVVFLGPGKITIPPDGGIRIVGAHEIRIENCSFEGLSVGRET